MNNRENQLEQQNSTPEKATGEQPDTVANSRRRILRAGLKVAPVVVATLATRPSLACHCVLPSAWGSINAVLGGNQDMGEVDEKDLTGSMARYQKSIIANFPSKKFSDFIGDGINKNAGWDALSGKFPFPSLPNNVEWTTAKKRAYLKGNDVSGLTNLTVAGLCEKMGCTTPLGSDNAKPIALIRQRQFGGSMLIAQINMYLDLLPPACINKSVLDTMATGSYNVPQTNETWTSFDGQIAAYLHNNWLARKDV